MPEQEAKCDHRRKTTIITGLGTWAVFGFPDLIVGDGAEIQVCDLLKSTPGCVNHCINLNLTQNECPLPYQDDGDEIVISRT
ncbi:MAG: hypothetical protein ABI758_04935 [Candidatus Woesebacteria bacterium]